MSAADRMMQYSQAMFNRMRSVKAREANDATPSGELAGLRGHKYCLVVTYRRRGEAVPTPVWFGIGDGVIYFRSLPHNGKTKRIRATPEVRIAPCTSRGRPLGPPFVGVATIVPPAQEAEAERCISANRNFMRRLYNPLVAQRVEGVYVMVAPAPKRVAASGRSKPKV
ncbi:MAG: hypothetical protein QOK28_2702 [Actinomycetota bacterium]